MVGLGGLEPPASPLSGVRSNHLSYRPNVASSDGGASRDRTDDPLLAKQVLSQLSYGPMLEKEHLKGHSLGVMPFQTGRELWMQVTCADAWTGNQLSLCL